MPQVVYNRGKFRIMSGATPLGTADLRMLLIADDVALVSGWNDPDLNTVADLDAVSGLTIHSERVALANESITQDDANDRANADADNVPFAAAPGETARAAVIYHHLDDVDDSLNHLMTGHSDNFPQPLDGGLSVQIADWIRGQAPA